MDDLQEENIIVADVPIELPKKIRKQKETKEKPGLGGTRGRRPKKPFGIPNEDLSENGQVTH